MEYWPGGIHGDEYLLRNEQVRRIGLNQRTLPAYGILAVVLTEIVDLLAYMEFPSGSPLRIGNMRVDAT